MYGPSSFRSFAPLAIARLLYSFFSRGAKTFHGVFDCNRSLKIDLATCLKSVALTLLEKISCTVTSGRCTETSMFLWSLPTSKYGKCVKVGSVRASVDTVYDVVDLITDTRELVFSKWCSRPCENKFRKVVYSTL